MDDLIDLTGAAVVKNSVVLSSPLIPSPNSDSQETKPASPNPRKSLDNNPFDMMSRKTSEYASKSSDPFEIVFEKALTNEIEDLPKKKRHSDVLKLNKTLDDSLINTSRLNLMVTPKSSRKSQENDLPLISIDPPSHESSILNQSAMNDSFQTFTDRLSMSKKISNLSMTPSKQDVSILNNSAMNDSLSASGDSSDDCCFLKSLIAQRVSMCIEKGTLEAKLLDNENDHNYKLRRSFSQGDRLTPKKSKIKRSMSIVNDGKNSLLNESSVPSILFEDPLNRAFMQRELSSYSSTADSSELSAITRFNSVGSGSFYSCKFTNDTANRGFINSDEISCGSGRDKSIINGSNLQDLVERFNNLRMKSDGSGCNADQSGGKSWGNESDSVFLDEDKFDSIFVQAKVLAKTFEDLAQKSSRGSSSSGDNLLSSRLPSHLELSSECSVPSINLIDLPISPKQSQSNLSTLSQTAGPPEIAQVPVNNGIANITQLERDFLDSDKEIVAANLLRDLEKLVKNENNQVAMELVGNLEKALGVKPDNNLKLLNTISIEQKSDHEIPQNPVNLSDELNKSSDKNTEMFEKTNDEDEIKLNEEAAGCSSGDNTHQDPENPQQEENPNLDTSICKISKSVSPPPQLSADSFTNQKLILDLQLALGKLLEGCKGEPVLLLENLNKVLYTKPTESRIPKSPRKSSSAPVKLPNPPEYQKIQKPAKTFSLRRHSSLTPSSEIEKKSGSVRVDSPKREVKRRNSNNPDAGDDEKKRINVNLKLKTTLPAVDKTKLKKKSDGEIRRGPMKALVPLVKMQCLRPGKKESTPPKKHKPSALNLVSSTPDPHEIILGKKKNKTKPVASSTPDVQQGSWRRASQIPQSPKANMSWNISPVTPNAKENISDVMKRSCTPKKADRSFEKATKGSLRKVGDRLHGGRRSEPILLSPRSEKCRNIKMTSPGPLKEKNSIKTKPMNLNSKFRGRSGSLGHMEKENKY